MNCPSCTTRIELSWSRYLRSLSGRHTCPACATTFRFKLTKSYLLLWLDIIAVALITGIIVRIVLTERFAYAPDDPQLLVLSIIVPVSIWGSVFLAVNRRALDRLETKPARGPAVTATRPQSRRTGQRTRT